MTEIINLRRARKAKGRLDREREAAENRARFGTPLAVRKRERAEVARATRELAGKKIERK
jgi:hypothetical protein